jgi:hypothetical protein
MRASTEGVPVNSRFIRNFQAAVSDFSSQFVKMRPAFIFARHATEAALRRDEDESESLNAAGQPPRRFRVAMAKLCVISAVPGRRR